MMLATAAFRRVGVGRTVRLLEHSLLATNGRVLDVASNCVGFPGGRGSNSSNNNDFLLHHCGNTCIRWFSATPPPKEDEPDDDGGNIIIKTFRSMLTPQAQFYALLGGGVVVTYGVSKIFLGFTNFFTHLTPTYVAKFGFYTGFGFATLVGGAAFIAFENLFIRTDPVFKYAYKWVRNDAVVQSKLGDGLTAGSLRSYRLDAGKFELVGKTPVWRPPRIQLLFDITASGPPYRTGLVTCEAIKSSGFPPRLHTTLLKVDYETGNEGEGGTREGDETHFLAGSEAEMARVSKRSGLSLATLARSVHINKAAAGKP